MSTLRNTVQRRTHRERAQPLERQKWGLLEKPKDYKLRAADHKVKKRKIKTLQQKANERNEDEFYFGMMNSQSLQGVKVSQWGDSRVLGEEVVKLMKTQDVGYLRTVLQQTRRERESIGREVTQGEVGVGLTKPATGGKRVEFGEDGQAMAGAAVASPVPVGGGVWESTDEEDDDEGVETGGLSVQEKHKRRNRDSRRRKLQALEEREKDLTSALREVEQQRAKMNGSVGGVNKHGTKFKVRERKR